MNIKRPSIEELLDGMERLPEMWSQNIASLEDQYHLLLMLLHGRDAARNAFVRESGGPLTLAAQVPTYEAIVVHLRAIRAALGAREVP